MGTILSNGSLMYRYNNLILRSPLVKSISLTPSGQLRYDVGDNYRQSLPTSDFLTVSGSGTYSLMSFHKMAKAYLLRQMPTSAVQIWRDNTSFSTTRDPGYIFYGGNYSPAAAAIGGSQYITVPAYKFSIPSKYRNFSITSMTIQTAHHGVVLTSGNAGQVKTVQAQYPVFARDATTSLLPSNSGWRNATRELKFGIFAQSTFQNTDATNLFSSCQQTINITQNARTDACDNTGSNCAYAYWVSWPSGAVTYADGNVINALNPNLQTFTANTSLLNAASTLLAGGTTDLYLAMIPPVSDSGGTGYNANSDYPCYYYTPSAGTYQNFWLCERIQIKKIDLTLQLGDA